MKVFDNFLTQEEIKEVQDIVFSDSFPWMLSRKILSLDGSHHNVFTFNNIKESGGFQFVHVVSGIDTPRTEFAPVVFKVFNRFCAYTGVDADAVFRAKLNLTTQNHFDDRMAPHIDHGFDHNTFLYYVNDSDGDTVIFNEKFEKRGEDRELTEMHRFTPKAGTALLFNGKHYHTSLSPINTKMRVVINITYL